MSTRGVLLVVAVAAVVAIPSAFALVHRSQSVYAPGARLDYVENTTPVYNVPVGTDGDGHATLWIQGGALGYDGGTEICAEVYIAAMEPDFHQSIVANLYEGAHDLGAMIDSSTGEGAQDLTRDATTGYAKRCFTPAAGPHAYSVRVWATGGSLNRIYGGAGTCNPGESCGWMPSYLRITAG